MSQGQEDHHVHFDTTSVKKMSDFESDRYVTFERTGDNIFINLGFLQVDHRYIIDLKLPASIFSDLGMPTNQFKPVVATVPNLHCRITEFAGTKHDEHDFYEMKIEFFAYKEKLLRELLQIVNSNNKEVLKLVITASVLGKGKGTPMLRNGIHCIGVEQDDNSSAEPVF